MEKLYWPWN